MGMFFNRSSSFLPTRQQEDESAELARRLGVEGMTVSDGFNPMIAAGRQMAQQVAAPAPQQRPNIGREIVGRLGDALAQWGGGAPIYGIGQERQRQLEAAAAQAQAQRANDFADWERKERWKRDNPEAQEPNALERNRAYLNSIKPGLGDTYAENFASSGGGIPQLMNVPGVGVVSVPRATQPAAPSGPPAAAIEALRKNPALRGQFEQKYGVGSADQALGGPASAPASFR